jgi:hypothetical protein
MIVKSGIDRRGAVKGSTWKAHRYIARVPLGGDKFRYFYTPQQVAAYKAEKKRKQVGGDSIERVKDSDKKKKDRAVKIGSGAKGGGGGGASSSNYHFVKSKIGEKVKGYRAGEGKPEGMSDELWERYQKLWGFASSSTVKAKRKKSKSKDTVKKSNVRNTTTSGQRAKKSSKKRRKVVDQNTIMNIIRRV